MAKPKTPIQKTAKNDVINFVLKVKASRRPDGPIELSLDLNPDSRMIKIDETFSSREELSKILAFVNDVLREVDERTCKYNDVLQIDQRKQMAFFSDGYEQNFKPTFGKIDKIIHRHNSPGESTVSIARTYNGDKRP
jgi:hypothetical protein